MTAYLLDCNNTPIGTCEIPRYISVLIKDGVAYVRNSHIVENFHQSITVDVSHLNSFVPIPATNSEVKK